MHFTAQEPFSYYIFTLHSVVAYYSTYPANIISQDSALPTVVICQIQYTKYTKYRIIKIYAQDIPHIV